MAAVLDGMDLTDAQWAVLWVLRTGAAWHDLPGRYPLYDTCHRRFQLWCAFSRISLRC